MLFTHRNPAFTEHFTLRRATLVDNRFPAQPRKKGIAFRPKSGQTLAMILSPEPALFSPVMSTEGDR
jgi:hypothetical protein